MRGAFRSASLVVASLAVAAACSIFDPVVGPLQPPDAGAPASSCTLPANGYAASYGSPTGDAATADFCTADGGTIGGPCDVCEAAHCCADRVACYSDHTCACADEAIDTCTGGVAPDAGDAGTAATLACWSAFAASGTIARMRYACLWKWCAAACGIPD